MDELHETDDHTQAGSPVTHSRGVVATHNTTHNTDTATATATPNRTGTGFVHNHKAPAAQPTQRSATQRNMAQQKRTVEALLGTQWNHAIITRPAFLTGADAWQRAVATVGALTVLHSDVVAVIVLPQVRCVDAPGVMNLLDRLGTHRHAAIASLPAFLADTLWPFREGNVTMSSTRENGACMWCVVGAQVVWLHVPDQAQRTSRCCSTLAQHGRYTLRLPRTTALLQSPSRCRTRCCPTHEETKTHTRVMSSASHHFVHCEHATHRGWNAS